MNPETVTQVTGLTLQAAAMIVCVVLWKAYNAGHAAHLATKDEHIAYLRDNNQNQIYELKARMMVVEDNAGVKRTDRNFYLPPANEKEAAALDDLDYLKK